MINNDFNPYDELETHSRILRDHRDHIEMLVAENVRINDLLVDVTRSNVELSALVVQTTRLVNDIYSEFWPSDEAD